MKENDKIYNAICLAMSQLADDKTLDIPTAGFPMPSLEKLEEVVRLCREVAFPGFFSKGANATSSEYHRGVNIEQLAFMIRKEIYASLCLICHSNPDFCRDNAEAQSEAITADFISWLPEFRRLLCGDVQSIFDGDPAATSHVEVIFAYPSVKAISSYRIAHKLGTLGVPLLPRVISEMAHTETGIDIHPDAQIGERFAIDHGTGVVIGATCIIGNNVKIYQGVTLGAKSFTQDANGNLVKGIPRHPIIGDNVVIYAQATILGRIHIGDRSVVGGNVWLTHDVPADARVNQSNCQSSR